jgi:hypothetical protein
MSGMQYIDGRFIFEDMRELARQKPGKRITVNWIPNRPDQLHDLTPRARTCVRKLRSQLDDYMQSCGLDSKRIEELRTEVYVAANSRLYVRAFARDDRGREYKSFIGT